MIPVDPVRADPPLLNEHSDFKTYTTTKFTYPDLRVFYRQHAKVAELPKVPYPLPLLVFVHGLGGSVAQFHQLLTSFLPVAPCLAVDLPGCGRSAFVETSWDAYTTEALAELLEIIIEDYRDKKAGQHVVLIGHSMGSALCAHLASKKTPHTTKLVHHIDGLVAICPVSGPFSEEKTKQAKLLLWIPGWIFNLWRMWDRRGGTESASVKRFVGEDADPESKRLQYIFNCQSRTPVWRRMAHGALPTYQDGVPHGGLPTMEIWGDLDIPIFLVAGESDAVTPPTEAVKLASLFEEDGIAKPKLVSEPDSPNSTSRAQSPGAEDSSQAGTDDTRTADMPLKKSEGDVDSEPTTPRTPAPPNQPDEVIPDQPLHPKGVMKTLIMPSPANHALLYMPMTVRILAGNISDFLSTYITGRLALSWQLQYLAKEGKWELKNLTKWRGVNPVSKPIGPAGVPVFLAMKTLREVDEVHCPAEYVRNWGGKVSDVIDISRDQPSYDPTGLQKGGIAYHKLSTVSKIPPPDEEVNKFIDLVDSIRSARPAAGEGDGEEEGRLIGVHCHYGFNRTGYFIVCYLVERCGFGVQEAMEAFAAARPNGIRHQHFRDKLCMKYGMLGKGAQNGS